MPTPMVPVPFSSMTASFPSFNETMALPAYPPLSIGGDGENGMMPMESWNALVNSLPDPTNGKSQQRPFSMVNDIFYLLDPFVASTSDN